MVGQGEDISQLKNWKIGGVFIPSMFKKVCG